MDRLGDMPRFGGLSNKINFYLEPVTMTLL